MSVVLGSIVKNPKQDDVQALTSSHPHLVGSSRCFLIQFKILGHCRAQAVKVISHWAAMVRDSKLQEDRLVLPPTCPAVQTSHSDYRRQQLRWTDG